MTNEEILQVARESGFEVHDVRLNFKKELITFAHRIAAMQIEIDAGIAEAEADKMEQAAQRAIENNEHDEVSSIRSTAWKLSVAAQRIRKNDE